MSEELAKFRERVYWDSHWHKKTNELHIWSYDSSHTLQKDIIIQKPYIYVESPEPGAEGRVSVAGKPVKKVVFKDYFEMTNAMKELTDAEANLIQENNFVPMEMGIIADLFPAEPPFDHRPKIIYFDIEVFSSHGFPLPSKAAWPVTSICICRGYENDRMIVYGSKPLTDEEISKLPDQATYVYCENEGILFMYILAEFDAAHIIAGWYSNQFDIPYLLNRLPKVAIQFRKDKQIGPTLSKGFNLITVDKSVNLYESYDTNEKKNKYHITIPGKGLVDLLEVYKKYSYIKLPSYSLDYVGKFEFGEGKLKFYADKGVKELSLSNLYHNDWFNYIAYNIRDVALTKDIDLKRGLSSLVLEINRISRVPTARSVFMSAIIDGALLSFLRDQNMVAMGRRLSDKEKFTGGFVKPPHAVWGSKNLYRHTCCFDVTSEYPSVVCKLNVSSETYIGKIQLPIFSDLKEAALIRNARGLFPEDSKEILHIDVYRGAPFDISVEDLMDKLDKGEWSVSGDGVLFSMSKKGVFADFTEKGFDHRKKFKRLYQKHRDLYEANKKEEDKQLSDLYNTKQAGWKLILNSGYGQTGSRFSRLYNPHIAQAITSTGQAVVFNGERFINEFFNHRFKECESELLEFIQKYNPNIKQIPFWDTTIVDRVVTMDTDSIIFTMDDLTNVVFDESKKPSKDAVEFINTLLKTFVGPQLNTYLNEDFSKNRLKSDRVFKLGFELEGEKTSVGSIFLRKKKYILNLPSGKFKVTGYEMKKVDTPPDIAKGLEDFVHKVFDHGHSWKHGLEGFIMAIHMAQDLAKILTQGSYQEICKRLSYSSSVSDVEKYKSTIPNELFAKGAPMHIKGAILHNWIVEQRKMDIPLIYSGERANILKVKETLPRANAVAFKEVMPSEFQEYFEPDVYEVISTKFLNKCDPLFGAFGWEKQWTNLIAKLYKWDPDWVEKDYLDVSIIDQLDRVATTRAVVPRNKVKKDV